jgi:EmrB/QacA subfamily drug resistance transporter
MEQMDSTVISTSLPEMAHSLGVDPLRMNLAITAYLISLVIFIPASGTLADRHGARRVFCSAIVLFMASSIFCGLASTLNQLIAGRILQGISGAMMVPVGRLIVLRSVDKTQLIEAMAWVLMPAMIGPMIGPPLGGFITTYYGWHWIFFINVPIGIAGLVMAMIHVPPLRAEERIRFDLRGMVLIGVCLAAMIYGLELYSRGDTAWSGTGLFLGLGIASGAAYALHARRCPRPVLDFSLVRIQSFSTAFIGGTMMRIGFGALPFLLPLMLQLGMGLDPLQSGMTMLAAGLAAVAAKGASVSVLRRYGYRRVLLWNGALCTLSLALCACFGPGWSIPAIAGVLLLGGLARSLQYNVFGTFAYADVPAARMSAATSLNSTAQQLSATLGVALSVCVLQTSMQWANHAQPQLSDFSITFIVVALATTFALPMCYRLPADSGQALSAGRRT